MMFSLKSSKYPPPPPISHKIIVFGMISYVFYMTSYPPQLLLVPPSIISPIGCSRFYMTSEVQPPLAGRAYILVHIGSDAESGLV